MNTIQTAIIGVVIIAVAGVAYIIVKQQEQSNLVGDVLGAL